MDEQRGTQRQIAKRYEDRVDYKHTRTPWKRARFWISLLLLLGGFIAIYFVEKKKPPEFFNTGPLSRPHSHLKDGCASCHVAERLTSHFRRTTVFFSDLERSDRQRRPFLRADR